jgi:hypothetical protein
MNMIKGLLRRPTFWYPFLILLAIGWVGGKDFEDAELQQNHYCIMVAEGAWPDYNRLYKSECVALGYPVVPAVFISEGDTTR